MRNKNLMAVAAAMILTLGPVYAGSVGTTSADILKINNGARPAGIGGAYTALGDDAYSVNYNPAGLGGVKVPQLILLHSDHLAGIAYEYMTFASPWAKDRTLSLHINYRHTPPIDNKNNLPPVSTSDMLACLSAAKRWDNFNVGLSFKYIHSNLDVVSATAFAGDIGIQFTQLPYHLKAGLAVQNVGTGMKFIEQKDPLPMFIRGGLAWNTKLKGKRELNLSVDLFKPSDQGMKMGFGGECWLFEDLFVIRGGAKREGLIKNPGNLFNNYTLGFTLTRPVGANDIALDFAFNPATYDLTTEDTYFAALNFKFNNLKVF